MKTNSVSSSSLNYSASKINSCQLRNGARCFRPAALLHGGNTAPCLIILLLALVWWPGSACAQGNSGILLTTFTNSGGGLFGSRVAAVGSGQVLIGDRGANTGTVAAGAAYLFSLNGTLLTTFTNPTPADFDAFGWTVAALGSDRVLVGAPFDGADGAGVAYLFSTNGTLLTTFTNPAPMDFDSFGNSVAASGSDRVLIGKNGAAYLFALPYPPLSIARNAATVSVSWVTAETGLILQQTGLLGTPTVWSNTTDSVSINDLTNVVQQTMATTNRFFRLRRP